MGLIEIDTSPGVNCGSPKEWGKDQTVIRCTKKDC